MIIDHIVLTVLDIEKTKEFYDVFLGEPYEVTKESLCYRLGETLLFLGLPYNELNDSTFNANRAGLNHLAFNVSSLEELKDLERKLNAAGITHSGVKIDKYGKKEFIWFDDPSGIRLEFYLRNNEKIFEK